MMASNKIFREQQTHFFFSLFHQRAHDEALTRLLQTSLFLVASPILVKSMFFSFKSSLTLSIQVLLLLLFPSACPCKAAFGSLFPSICSTCPNHCSLLFLVFCVGIATDTIMLLAHNKQLLLVYA